MTCDRERKWISLALDGELSELEHALMAAHLERCADCSAYAAEVRSITNTLRSAPPEPLESGIWVGVPARLGAARARLRIAPVASAAAVVVAAVIGLTAFPDGGPVGNRGGGTAAGTRLADGALVNELVLAVRRPQLEEGAQPIVPEARETPGVKPPLGAIPGI